MTDEYIEEKVELANRTGGKYAPSSFFAGILDTVKDRYQFIQDSLIIIFLVLINLFIYFFKL